MLLQFERSGGRGPVAINPADVTSVSDGITPGTATVSLRTANAFVVVGSQADVTDRLNDCEADRTETIERRLADLIHHHASQTVKPR